MSIRLARSVLLARLIRRELVGKNAGWEMRDQKKPHHPSFHYYTYETLLCAIRTAEELMMKAAIRKHSVTLYGLKTSVSLEDVFWDGLKDMAQARGTTRLKLIAETSVSREGNLSSALRVRVFKFYRSLAEKLEGEIPAGRILQLMRGDKPEPVGLSLVPKSAPVRST